MHKRVLTLSEDKFTLTITHNKIKNSNNNTSNNYNNNNSTSLVDATAALIKPILRKVTSYGSSSYLDDDSNKCIDIGSIERIQRGQSTFKFELARYVLYKVYLL